MAGGDTLRGSTVWYLGIRCQPEQGPPVGFLTRQVCADLGSTLVAATCAGVRAVEALTGVYWWTHMRPSAQPWQERRAQGPQSFSKEGGHTGLGPQTALGSPMADSEAPHTTASVLGRRPSWPQQGTALGSH